jgi:hypothetical protein
MSLSYYPNAIREMSLFSEEFFKKKKILKCVRCCIGMSPSYG